MSGSGPSFGEIAKAERNRQGLTRDDLSDRIKARRKDDRTIRGVSASAIRDAESGKGVRPATMRAIALGLGFETLDGLLAIVAPMRITEAIPAERRETLAGEWNGTGTQLYGRGGEPIPLNGTMRLTLTEKEVVGTVTLKFQTDGRSETQEFRCAGTFLYDRFLKLDYWNQISGVVQFGTLILQLDDENLCLEGTYAGYGSKTKKPVLGQVKVWRGFVFQAGQRSRLGPDQAKSPARVA